MSDRLVHKYGITSTARMSDLDVELFCFLHDHQPEDGGLGRYRHFRNICNILFAKVEWERDGVQNDWLQDQCRSLCDQRGVQRIGDVTVKEIVWAGCAAAGKTYASVLFSVVWWLAAPADSIVILTSTTSQMVGIRIWPLIESLYFQVQDKGADMGRLVSSKMRLECISPNGQRDAKHAIRVIAVGGGETSKAASNIQGQHARRILVVIDEATDVREAILMAVKNMMVGCEEIILLKIGNAKSRMDPLGLAMEPKDGWNSVTVDDYQWETKMGGHCIHFDGFKSPNIHAQKSVFKFLSSYEDYLRWQRSDKHNTLEYWMYHRGYPPPEGVSNTVISEAMILNHDGLGKHLWLSKVEVIAALDPGFGGDGCKLQFAEMGDIEGGGIGIQLTDSLEIKLKQIGDVPVDKQISQQVIAECKARGVRAACFGQDATGIGRGVFAELYQEWGAKIIRVEFGGAASDTPASRDDPRPCNEVYDRRVTELWFNVRTMIEQDQIKGFSVDAVKQFCARTYDHKGKRISIEKKEEYKSRIGRSPDDADAIAVLVEVARRNGAISTGSGSRSFQNDWSELAASSSILRGRPAERIPGLPQISNSNKNRPQFSGPWLTRK